MRSRNCLRFVSTWINPDCFVESVLLICWVMFLCFVSLLCLVCPKLSVSLDCPFLIAPSVFSNMPIWRAPFSIYVLYCLRTRSIYSSGFMLCLFSNEYHPFIWKCFMILVFYVKILKKVSIFSWSLIPQMLSIFYML